MSSLEGNSNIEQEQQQLIADVVNGYPEALVGEDPWLVDDAEALLAADGEPPEEPEKPDGWLELFPDDPDMKLFLDLFEHNSREKTRGEVGEMLYAVRPTPEAAVAFFENCFHKLAVFSEENSGRIDRMDGVADFLDDAEYFEAQQKVDDMMKAIQSMTRVAYQQITDTHYPEDDKSDDVQKARMDWINKLGAVWRKINAQLRGRSYRGTQYDSQLEQTTKHTERMARDMEKEGKKYIERSVREVDHDFRRDIAGAAKEFRRVVDQENLTFDQVMKAYNIYKANVEKADERVAKLKMYNKKMGKLLPWEQKWVDKADRELRQLKTENHEQDMTLLAELLERTGELHDDFINGPMTLFVQHAKALNSTSDEEFDGKYEAVMDEYAVVKKQAETMLSQAKWAIMIKKKPGTERLDSQSRKMNRLLGKQLTEMEKQQQHEEMWGLVKVEQQERLNKRNEFLQGKIDENFVRMDELLQRANQLSEHIANDEDLNLQTAMWYIDQANEMFRSLKQRETKYVYKHDTSGEYNFVSEGTPITLKAYTNRLFTTRQKTSQRNISLAHAAHWSLSAKAKQAYNKQLHADRIADQTKRDEKYDALLNNEVYNNMVSLLIDRYVLQKTERRQLQDQVTDGQPNLATAKPDEVLDRYESVRQSASEKVAGSLDYDDLVTFYDAISVYIHRKEREYGVEVTGDWFTGNILAKLATELANSLIFRARLQKEYAWKRIVGVFLDRQDRREDKWLKRMLWYVHKEYISTGNWSLDEVYAEIKNKERTHSRRELIDQTKQHLPGSDSSRHSGATRAIDLAWWLYTEKLSSKNNVVGMDEITDLNKKMDKIYRRAGLLLKKLIFQDQRQREQDRKEEMKQRIEEIMNDEELTIREQQKKLQELEKEMREKKKNDLTQWQEDLAEVDDSDQENKWWDKITPIVTEVINGKPIIDEEFDIFDQILSGIDLSPKNIPYSLPEITPPVFRMPLWLGNKVLWKTPWVNPDLLDQEKVLPIQLWADYTAIKSEYDANKSTYHPDNNTLLEWYFHSYQRLLLDEDTPVEKHILAINEQRAKRLRDMMRPLMTAQLAILNPEQRRQKNILEKQELHNARDQFWQNASDDHFAYDTDKEIVDVDLNAPTVGDTYTARALESWSETLSQLRTVLTDDTLDELTEEFALSGAVTINDTQQQNAIYQAITNDPTATLPVGYSIEFDQSWDVVDGSQMSFKLMSDTGVEVGIMDVNQAFEQLSHFDVTRTLDGQSVQQWLSLGEANYDPVKIAHAVSSAHHIAQENQNNLSQQTYMTFTGMADTTDRWDGTDAVDLDLSTMGEARVGYREAYKFITDKLQSDNVREARERRGIPLCDQEPLFSPDEALHRMNDEWMDETARNRFNDQLVAITRSVMYMMAVYQSIPESDPEARENFLTYVRISWLTSDKQWPAYRQWFIETVVYQRKTEVVSQLLKPETLEVEMEFMADSIFPQRWMGDRSPAIGQISSQIQKNLTRMSVMPGSSQLDITINGFRQSVSDAQFVKNINRRSATMLEVVLERAWLNISQAKLRTGTVLSLDDLRHTLLAWWDKIQQQALENQLRNTISSMADAMRKLLDGNLQPPTLHPWATVNEQEIYQEQLRAFNASRHAYADVQQTEVIPPLMSQDIQRKTQANALYKKTFGRAQIEQRLTNILRGGDQRSDKVEQLIVLMKGTNQLAYEADSKMLAQARAIETKKALITDLLRKRGKSFDFSTIAQWPTGDEYNTNINTNPALNKLFEEAYGTTIQRPIDIKVYGHLSKDGSTNSRQKRMTVDLEVK